MNRKIKYFVMDVDGTLTDGKIYMSVSGEMIKAFNIKDGYGIHDILIPNKIIPVIITGRESLIVEKRCRELGVIDLFQGIKNKMTILDSFLKTNNSNLSEVAYMGDDINDLNCIEAVNKAFGLTGCPVDAVQQVKDKCHFTSSKKGGEGAVREFIEWIFKFTK